MTFFRRKRKNAVNADVKVDEVYVVTSTIVSSYNDETGYGPMYVFSSKVQRWWVLWIVLW